MVKVGNRSKMGFIFMVELLVIDNILDNDVVKKNIVDKINFWSGGEIVAHISDLNKVIYLFLIMIDFNADLEILLYGSNVIYLHIGMIVDSPYEIDDRVLDVDIQDNFPFKGLNCTYLILGLEKALLKWPWKLIIMRETV